jgi:putative nucleotidyltransferase with HDIG domain
MKPPNKKECLELLKKYNTPENIIKHSLKVNEISVFLAKKLKQKGIKIDIDLLNAGSLLHDIKKWDEIRNNKISSHGFDGYNLFKNKLPKLADVIKKHMLYQIPYLKTWEEKIVHYADRRVNHDKIVSLEKRFDYLNKRYPAIDKKKRKKIYELNKKLEKEIFSKIDIKPEEIEEFI